MNTMHALAQICHQLGGRLAIVSRKEFDDLSDASDDLSLPFTAGSRYEYGIHWDRKIIYTVRGTPHIGFVIHEAGHVFADHYPPDNDKCNEWEWLGWEIAVARQIGAMRAWSRQNAAYHLGKGIHGGIGADKDWSRLSTKERRAIIADRLAHAQKIGLIDADGNPRSVR